MITSHVFPTSKAALIQFEDVKDFLTGYIKVRFLVCLWYILKNIDKSGKAPEVDK